MTGYALGLKKTATNVNITSGKTRSSSQSRSSRKAAFSAAFAVVLDTGTVKLAAASDVAASESTAAAAADSDAS